MMCNHFFCIIYDCHDVTNFFFNFQFILLWNVPGWSIKGWIQVAVIPAALYSVQNLAALTAYQNLEPVTFNVLNQTKTLSAALCCYLLMGRKQSPLQILSLFILLLSALVIEKIIDLERFFGMVDESNDGKQLDTKSQTEEHSMNHWSLGVFPILLASFISGLAGAISQKNLQSNSGCGASGGKNSFLFTMELCVASILIMFVSSLVTDGNSLTTQQNHDTAFFHDWTWETFIPILTNASGGIIVGLVTKYAGSVRKGFSLIFGILLSGIAQTALDSKNMEKEQSGSILAVSKEELIGGLLAAISLWMHATNPLVPAVTKQVQTTSKSSTEDRTQTASSTTRRPRKARKED